ncbi:MAG: TrkH family potassium uptake protein [Oscillospiraceae bacterium]|nr:TrkH family potassium uptake protein [Oscillospiraceae bacterium]
MNISMIFYILGWVLCTEAGAMLFPCIISVIYSETTGIYYLITLAVCLVTGLAIIFRKPKNTRFYAKEGFAIVALSWIVMSLIGAVPLCISGDIPSFMSALFETVSGFTTTGATNLTDIDALSRTSLFWRSETHWIGGMGVLVLILTLLPIAGGQNIQLMRAESPGPTVDKFKPRLRHTAMILYIIYFIMTVIEIMFLLFGGLSMFDAVTIAFSTAGTGGFTASNAGINAFHSSYIEIVLTVFMILFSVNFSFYYMMLARRFKDALKNSEVWTYLGIILTSGIIISLNIYKMFPSVKDTLRNAFFAVSSIISTTGFCTADFDKWPQLSRLILVLLMFFGACAGSTGGGIKISRIMVMVKSAVSEVRHTIHPKSVNAIKFSGKRVPTETVRNIKSFFIIEMIILAASALVVSLDNFDSTSTVTAVITCMQNVGPGLNAVGPTGNFASFSVLSKIVLIFDMLAGRLEIMPLLVLFSPSAWKKN